MSVTVLGFNLFKLFIIGELVVCGCLNLLDAVLTGDVFFTVSLLRISLVFLLFLTSSVLVAASGSSLGLFLLYFPLVVLLGPKSSTVIMTSLLSLFLVSSCQVFCWVFLVLLQLLCEMVLLVLLAEGFLFGGGGLFWLTVAVMGLVVAWD